jgi:hypothetical protein
VWYLRQGLCWATLLSATLPDLKQISIVTEDHKLDVSRVSSMERKASERYEQNQKRGPQLVRPITAFYYRGSPEDLADFVG